MKMIRNLMFSLFLLVPVFANAQTVPIVNFNPTTVSITEGGYSCDLNVTRNGLASAAALTVNLTKPAVFGTGSTSILDINNSDGGTGEVIVEAYDADAGISGLSSGFCLFSNDNDIVAPDVSGTITITSGSAYQKGGQSNLNVTLKDDDQIRLTVRQNRQLNQNPATKTFTVTAYKDASKDYTFNWSAVGNVITDDQSNPLTITEADTSNPDNRDDDGNKFATFTLAYDCSSHATPWIEITLDTSLPSSNSEFGTVEVDLDGDGTATTEGKVVPDKEAWYVCGTRQVAPDGGNAVIVVNAEGEPQVQEGGGPNILATRRTQGKELWMGNHFLVAIG